MPYPVNDTVYIRMSDLSVSSHSLFGMRAYPSMASFFLGRLAQCVSISPVFLVRSALYFFICMERLFSTKGSYSHGSFLVYFCLFDRWLSFDLFHWYMINEGDRKMTQEKIDMYVMTNQKYLPAEKIIFIKQKLQEIDEEKFSLVSTVEFKDPTTILLVSLFLGSFGVDRFMMGDTAMGILKLVTMGLCGILTIVDWFSVQKKTRDMNYNNLMMVL